jgi:DNA-binding MurR/RpiR family transcriptional regulator
MEQKGTKLSAYLRLSEFLFSNYNNDVNYSIARVLLDKIHEFPDINIEEIAYLAKTTPGSVTKFCKKMNYSSFKELKTDLSSYKGTNIFSDFQQQTKQIGMEKSLDFFLNEVNRKFTELFHLFEKPQLERIAKRIDKATSVAVLGGNYGFGAIHLFFELLVPYHIPFIAINRKSETEIIKSVLWKEDIIFIISLSGQWINQRILELDLPEEISKKIVLITYKSPDTYKHLFSEVVSFEKCQDYFNSSFISSNALNVFFIILTTYLGTYRANEKSC